MLDKSLVNITLETPPAEPSRGDQTLQARHRRPWWRRYWIGIAVGLVIAIIAATLWANDPGSAAVSKTSEAKPSAEDRMRVTVSIAAPASFEQDVGVIGLLAARNAVSIGASVAGQRITRVLVEVGDKVLAGQVLAQLETDTLAAQARQAEASVARARADLAQAEATNIEAQANLRRVDALSGSSVVSGQQADERRAAAQSAAAAVEGARADLSSAQALSSQSRTELARARIVAPDAGVISARSARVGALAEGTSSLFEMIQDGEIEFLAEVPERFLGQILEGQTVLLDINGSDEPVRGRVRVVEPTIDPQSRQAKVRVALLISTSPISALRAGTFARGRILLGETRFDIAVPETALARRQADQAVVMVVDQAGKIVAKPVRLGRSHEGRIEIVSGLRAGERVVQNAGAFLREGDIIEPVQTRVAGVTR